MVLREESSSVRNSQCGDPSIADNFLSVLTKKADPVWS